MEKRKNRFSDSDFAVIKGVFAENEELIEAIRKLVLQLPLDEMDRAQLDAAFKSNPEAQKIVHRCYLPSISEPWPLLHIYDLWFVDPKDKSVQDAEIALDARSIVVQYLTEQMKRLESGNYEVQDGSIILSDLVPNPNKKPEEKIRELVARNTIISGNESNLNMLNILAGQKKETNEEMLKRIAADSSK